MRYIRYKTIKSKVFDQIVEDPEDVQLLLAGLKDKEVTCVMQVGSEPCHDFVRIIEVNNEKITWKIIAKSATLQKTSLITDIKTIEVNTSDEVMAQLKPEPSRWSTLDTSDV